MARCWPPTSLSHASSSTLYLQMHHPHQHIVRTSLPLPRPIPQSISCHFCWDCPLQGTEAARVGQLEAALLTSTQPANGLPARLLMRTGRTPVPSSMNDGRGKVVAVAAEVSPLMFPSACRRKPLGCDRDVAPAPASQKPGSHHYRPSARPGAVAPLAGTRPFFSLESPGFGYLQLFLRERQEAEWIRAIYGYLLHHVLVLWGWSRLEGWCTEASSILGLQISGAGRSPAALSTRGRVEPCQPVQRETEQGCKPAASCREERSQGKAERPLHWLPVLILSTWECRWEGGSASG